MKNNIFKYPDNIQKKRIEEIRKTSFYVFLGGFVFAIILNIIAGYSFDKSGFVLVPILTGLTFAFLFYTIQYFSIKSRIDDSGKGLTGGPILILPKEITVNEDNLIFKITGREKCLLWRQIEYIGISKQSILFKVNNSRKYLLIHSDIERFDELVSMIRQNANMQGTEVKSK